MHPADSIHEPATYVLRGFGQTDLALAGVGAPTVAEYAVPELAAALGLSTEAGKRFLGECLELRYRLPHLWDRLVTGDLLAWKARLVARETTRLSVEAAGFVDRQVAPVAHKIKATQLDRLVNEAIGRYMPAEVQRLAAESWDKRHVTLHDQLVSFTGTMTVSAELDIADALDLEAAVAAGAEQRAALGSHESLDVRRAQAIGDLARGQLSSTSPDSPTGRSQCPCPGRSCSTSTSTTPPSHGSYLTRSPGSNAATPRHHRPGPVLVRPPRHPDRREAGHRPQPVPLVRYRPRARPDRRTRHPARPDLCLPLVHPTRPPLRQGPHPPPRPQRPHLHLQHRTPVPTPSPAQDPHRVDLHHPRPRHLPVDQPPRLHLPPRPPRHPRRVNRPTPTTDAPDT